jgi:DNA-binding NarL/FixJ family response regulator
MQAVPAPTTVPIRVAVVEDDDSFRRAFLTAIEGSRDTAVAGVAVTRSEGLALLQGSPADVLLVDIGLPDGSGIDLICAAQKFWPGCSVVVTTIFADESHVMQCIEAGAVGYLLKDSQPQNIVDEIRSLHQGGSPISPQIARRVLQRLRAPMVAAHLLAAEQHAALSNREAEVLQLVAKGFSYVEIAQRLGVSRHTVLTFVRRIYTKLEVNSKMEAVNEARRTGLLV